MKPLTLLAIITVTLGIIIAAVPKNTTTPFKIPPDKLLEEIMAGTQFTSPEAVADLIIQKDPSIQLIDVRTSRDFDSYHLPGAINIPLQDILSPQWEDILHQGTKMNIFYSNGSVDAVQAWILTRQIGYENNYVLLGGLNYFSEVILNPTQPSEASADEEIAKYNFRKAASLALGGGDATEVSPQTDTQNEKLPQTVPVKKKKRVAGGC